MFNTIISLENLFFAWREFRRGKRNKQDVGKFELRLEDNIFALHEDLASGTYQHGPYERFHIFDPKHRIIHKATVRDRLVHHAVCRVLMPVFERSFIFDSYSCRTGKGTHAAVNRLEMFARKASKNNTQSCFALQLDIRKVFDSVNHAILLKTLQQKILCQRTNALFTEIVESYTLVQERELIGIPIGNLTSQLFVNVYLNGLDHFIKETLRLHCYIRYTDDMVVLHHDAAYLEGLITPIAAWLARERQLVLHPGKIKLRKLSQGIDFLGYVTLPHYRVLRTKTKRRMFRRVNTNNRSSYLGLLAHCSGHVLRRLIG